MTERQALNYRSRMCISREVAAILSTGTHCAEQLLMKVTDGGFAQIVLYTPTFLYNQSY